MTRVSGRSFASLAVHLSFDLNKNALTMLKRLLKLRDIALILTVATLLTLAVATGNGERSSSSNAISSRLRKFARPPLPPAQRTSTPEAPDLSHHPYTYHVVPSVTETLATRAERERVIGRMQQRLADLGSSAYSFQPVAPSLIAQRMEDHLTDLRNHLQITRYAQDALFLDISPDRQGRLIAVQYPLPDDVLDPLPASSSEGGPGTREDVSHRSSADHAASSADETMSQDSASSSFDSGPDEILPERASWAVLEVHPARRGGDARIEWYDYVTHEATNFFRFELMLDRSRDVKSLWHFLTHPI